MQATGHTTLQHVTVVIPELKYLEYSFYGVKKTPIVRIPEIRPTIEIYAPTALNVFIGKNETHT